MRKVLNVLGIIPVYLVIWLVVGVLINIGGTIAYAFSNPDDRWIDGPLNIYILLPMIVWTGFVLYQLGAGMVSIFRGATFRATVERIAIWRD